MVTSGILFLRIYKEEGDYLDAGKSIVSVRVSLIQPKYVPNTRDVYRLPTIMYGYN